MNYGFEQAYKFLIQKVCYYVEVECMQIHSLKLNKRLKVVPLIITNIRFAQHQYLREQMDLI